MNTGYAIHFTGKNIKTGKTTEMYVGGNHTFAGTEWFEPYKTEKGAKGAIASWKKFLRHDYLAGWQYEVKSVVFLTEQMLKNIEEQTQHKMLEALNYLSDTVNSWA